jgi:hypothetical protein
MNAVAEIYGRVRPAIHGLPLLILLPFAAELLQHAVEIRLGMYAQGGLAAAQAVPRMLFGVAKVLALLLTILLLLRWWGMGHLTGRMLRPGALFFRGLALLIVIQLGGDVLVLLLSRALVGALGPGAAPALRIAATVAPLLLWLFFILLLYPWFVGMVVEDNTMTARRSVAATRRHLWWAFGLLVVAVLPAMLAHYALSYGAAGRPPALVWTIMTIDAAVVAILTVLIASAQFTIYARAAERVAAA